MTDTNDKPTITGVKEKTKKRKGKLRENIESIAIAIALAFAIRYFVVEAFKIPTGSMAPTLLGEHKNVKCINCGWSFYADRQSETATCPNCNRETNVSLYCSTCNSKIQYRFPAWLWRKGICPKCKTVITPPDLTNRIIHGGNRILVNKFWYWFSTPKRWDVMVFVYPLDDLTCKNCSAQFPDTAWRSGLRCPQCGSVNFKKSTKNYIKRLVGLPGEKLQIVNGDLYINAKIQRKPDSAQDTLWMPVYNSNYPPREEAEPAWETDSGAWKINSHSLALNNVNTEGEETSLVTFGRVVSDGTGYNNRSGRNEMGDVKIRFQVMPARGSASLEVALEKNNDVFTAVIPTSDTPKKACLKKNGTVVMEKDTVLSPGQNHTIAFSNVDHVVTLTLDNSKVFVFDYDDGLVPDVRSFDTSKIRFGGSRISATFENIEIFHDIYYTELMNDTWGTTKPIQLGNTDYFMLGDNSRNSNDSRVWKFVPEKNIVGKAFFVFWPLDSIKFMW
ncbi:MAG: S26 family signal peptidase [Planctomycetota bacterium]